MIIPDNIPNTEKRAFKYFIQLKEVGFIKEIIFQPTSFELFKGLSKKFYKYKINKKGEKKKVYSKRKYMIQHHIYTPDFKIIWGRDAEIFIEHISLDEMNIDKIFKYHIENDEKVSYFEVKPMFDKFNMRRIFTNHIQPLIYSKYDIFVNLFIPERIFKYSFLPDNINIRNKDKNYLTLSKWLETLKDKL